MTTKRQPTPEPVPDPWATLPADWRTRGANAPEEKLGRTVRTLREARGLSQEQVAAKMTALGFSWQQTTVARTEAASRPIRVNEAVALSRVFQVAIDYLLEKADREQELRVRITQAQIAADHAHMQAQTAAAALAEAQRTAAEATTELHAAQHELADLVRSSTDGES